jgi:hypothetical protein
MSGATTANPASARRSAYAIASAFRPHQACRTTTAGGVVGDQAWASTVPSETGMGSRSGMAPPCSLERYPRFVSNAVR